MRHLQSWRTWTMASIVALAVQTGGIATSRAADCDYNTQPTVSYYWAYQISFQTRQVPVTITVTQRDYCGRAVAVQKTVLQSVQVPVKTLVLVADTDD